MAYNKLIATFIVSICWIPSSAQLSLPSLDLQLKGSVATIFDMYDKYNNIYNYSSGALYGELNWNITQHLAIGLFSSKSVFKSSALNSTVEMEGEYGSGNKIYTSSHFLYGGKLRISTGRQPKLRPFSELSFGKLELYMDKTNYRISTSSTFIGLSAGLMIRMSSKMYIVFPQMNLLLRSQSFFFEEPGAHIFNSKYVPFTEFAGGVSYNIGKKK